MKTKIANCKLQNARCKNSKEKEVIGMKRLIGLGLAILLVCGLSAVSFAGEATPQDVIITVVPVTAEAFTITPGTIALGTVGVGVSTGNVSALEIENTGNITLTFTKTVQSISGSSGHAWTMADPAEANKFLLKAQAQSAAGVWTNAGVKFSTTTTTYNDLTAADGTTQLSLDKDATENLWFMLDMPTSVDYSDSQTITARIKGTSE
jgi:hypothetical protein